jgi:AAA lid domain
MDTFFESNPGFRSRIAHHIDFPDYADEELLQIAETMLTSQNYALDSQARTALTEYIALRRAQPHFANARSVRNALDRPRLRQPNRLLGMNIPVTAAQLSTITAEDIRVSRAFAVAS